VFSVSDIYWQTLLGQAVTAVPMESKGRNSRIYKLKLADGKVLAGKAYFESDDDTRDRLTAEWTGLVLSRAAGLDVPCVYVGCRERNLLILEFVDGVSVTDFSSMDVKMSVDFLRVLGQVARGLENPTSVGPASEACFSGPELVRNLETRFERLTAARGDAPEYEDLMHLLDRLRQETSRWALTAENHLGRQWDVAIPLSQRILSPSDFGFHNALRRADGTLCFLDFEYFGWDDPAKTICDFVLHPAMALGQELAARFTTQCIRALDRGGLTRRLVAYFPLLVLKWCCIFLNEFAADDRARRRFAGCDARRGILRVQLDKVRTYMETIDERYERFCASLA
jgi:hypothetical protein